MQYFLFEEKYWYLKIRSFCICHIPLCTQPVSFKGNALFSLYCSYTLLLYRITENYLLQRISCLCRGISMCFVSNYFTFLQVIFSQSSDLLERQSSMASSTEEVSAPDLSAESRRNENDHFGVFKDFDFLEYESESVEVSYYSIKIL